MTKKKMEEKMIELQNVADDDNSVNSDSGFYRTHPPVENVIVADDDNSMNSDSVFYRTHPPVENGIVADDDNSMNSDSGFYRTHPPVENGIVADDDNSMNSDSGFYRTHPPVENGCVQQEPAHDNDEVVNQGQKLKTKSCDKCKNLESFQEQFNAVLEEKKQMNETLKEKSQEVDELKSQNRRLKLEMQKVRESSDNLTKRMATELNRKQIFEDVTNPCSPMKLAGRFKDIYNKEFYTIIEALGDADNETKVIQQLTDFMKTAYKGCCQKADQQIRAFLLLDDLERIPVQEENPDLYRLRYIASIQDDKRECVVQNVCREVLKDVHFEETTIMKKLETFLHKFTECVWLMTVSECQLVLNFDVVNKTYEGMIPKHFSRYTSQGDIDGCVNTIVGVVWPSVISKKGQDLYAKGEVLVTTTECESQEDAEEDNMSENGSEGTEVD